MKKKIVFFGICFFWLGFLSVFSEEDLRGKVPLNEKIVLSELIQEALEQNPHVKAAYQEWQASLQRIDQAKGFPDPILSYARFGQSIETRLGPQTDKISVSQKIPFFGKLAQKGRVAEQNSSIQEAAYEKARADIILGVKEAFFSMYWFEKAIAIRQEEREVLKRLSRIALRKYEGGQASQQDVLKAQLEISRVSERILALEQGKRAAESKLNALLNRAADAPYGKIGTIDIPRINFAPQELSVLGKQSRPELIQAEHVIAKYEESLRLAKKNNWPDVTLMVDYIFIGKGTTTHPEDGRNAWMGAIGINIPLWRSKYKAAEAEAAVNINASKRQYENIHNDTTSRINELYLEFKTYEDQVQLYEHSLLPQAEQSLKASEAGYVSGTADFLHLLESERMVLQIKTGLYKTISDMRKALARLERLVGQDLEELVITKSANRSPFGVRKKAAELLYPTVDNSKRQSEFVEGGLK
jgi:cobalt-zinc-cadmium efflux system outer membrane protein